MTCAHNNRRMRQHVVISPYRHADFRLPHVSSTARSSSLLCGRSSRRSLRSRCTRPRSSSNSIARPHVERRVRGATALALFGGMIIGLLTHDKFNDAAPYAALLVGVMLVQFTAVRNSTS
jgi:hypothetical protein